MQRTGFRATFTEVSEFQSACGGKAAVVAPKHASSKRDDSDAVFITSANFPGIIYGFLKTKWGSNYNNIVQWAFIFKTILLGALLGGGGPRQSITEKDSYDLQKKSPRQWA